MLKPCLKPKERLENERIELSREMAAHGHRRIDVAKCLGISLPTLRKRLRNLGLDRKPKGFGL